MTVREKIALIGSAPSSVRLAPYGDEEWDIWGCSPAAAQAASRVSAWFELHRWTPGVAPIAREYVDFLAAFPTAHPVYMQRPVKEVPASVAYPKDRMLKYFGRYFFTSSLAWMMALAITRDPQPKEIGIWGVDMATTEEWGEQRPGCQYFLEIARAAGIKVTLPPESLLNQPPPLYGYDTSDALSVQAAAHREQLVAQMMGAQFQKAQAEKNESYFKGCLDVHQLYTSMRGIGEESQSDSKPSLEVVVSRFAR